MSQPNNRNPRVHSGSIKPYAIIIAAMLLTSGCVSYYRSQPSSMQYAATINSVPVTGWAATWEGFKEHPVTTLVDIGLEGYAGYVAADAAWQKFKPSKDAAPAPASAGGASGATTYTFNGPTTFYQKGSQ